MEGKPNQVYPQGMRPFEQYHEICKYFAEGKQRDNDANETQKHLQLYDLSLGEYLVNKYALWLDFRKIDENELHGTGRRIENASEGITLQIEKKRRISWGSQCLHLPHHGCSVKHPKWHIRFCSVLDYKNVYERTACCIVRSSNRSRKNSISIEPA